MAQSGFTPILIYGSGSTGNTPAAGNLTTSASGVELALNYFDGKLFYKDNAGVVQTLAVKMPSGVLPVASGGTGLSSYTAGDLVYATGTTTLAKLGIGAANRVLTSTGSAPQWVTSLTGLTGVSSSGLTNTSLTSGRVVYSTTGGAQTDSANLTFDGSTLSVNGVNVGRGGGSVANNTAVGTSTLNANTSGDNNSAFGVAALLTNSTGAQNTAVGVSALRLSTTSNNNTAVGFQAAYSNTTGAGNTAIGQAAAYSNTTGAANVAVGAESAYSNQTGVGLVAIGYRAAYSSTANMNVAIGYRTMRLGTTGTRNIAIGGNGVGDGSSTLEANLTSTDNVAVGFGALQAHTTNNNNVAIGTNALSTDVSGNENTAVGTAALGLNQSGSSLTGLGYGAGYSNTTGSSSTYIGHLAGYLGTTGSFNVAVGRQALYSNTTASNNTALGYQALNANTTANDNTAVGTSALLNSTGGSNVAVGSSALRSNTTASQGVAVGYRALYSNTTTSNNVAVGNDAAFNNTTGGVIAVGYQSLYQNITGTGNTAIGYQALNANGRSVTAGSFVVGVSYTIQSIGTTDFTLIGAASNTVGVVFTATGVGTGTGTAASNTNNNTAFGYQAGLANTSGSSNIFFGVGAGSGVTTGNFNIIIGSNGSGLATMTGSKNVIMGHKAGVNVTSGFANLFIGPSEGGVDYGCGQSMTTGYQNVALGAGAMAAVQTAYANIAIGNTAMLGSASTTGIENVAIGNGSGYSLTTGSRNTFVGSGGAGGAGNYSGYYITTGSANTIIGSYNGNQGGLDIRTASGYIVLSDGNGNPRAYWNAANATFGGTLTVTTSLTANDGTAYYTAGTNGGILQLGTGLANPARIRSFSPSPRGSATELGLAFDIVTSAGTQFEAARIDSLGNVGLGQTPSVYGDTPKLLIYGGASSTSPTIEVSQNGTGVAYHWQMRNGNGIVGWMGSDNTSFVFGTGTSTERMRITSSGNLLVGTTTNNASGGVIQVSNGITFPAAQSASTDANTLDDYEEGTWTPAIEGSTTAGVGTYTSRNGYYTKIGRQVTCSFWIDWSAHTGTGNLRISGFPFAVANLSNNYACGVFGETANLTVSANNVLSSFTLSSTATVAIVLQRPIGGTTDTQVPIDASAYTMGTITYFSA